jgi:hypothetical protein
VNNVLKQNESCNCYHAHCHLVSIYSIILNVSSRLFEASSGKNLAHCVGVPSHFTRCSSKIYSHEYRRCRTQQKQEQSKTARQLRKAAVYTKSQADVCLLTGFACTLYHVTCSDPLHHARSLHVRLSTLLRSDKLKGLGGVRLRVYFQTAEAERA